MEIYVRACTILCTRVITTENLKLLIAYFFLFEQINGPELCSINMLAPTLPPCRISIEFRAYIFILVLLL